MDIHMSIELMPTNESLSEFGKKFRAYRNHIQTLQLEGVLPRNEIKWKVKLSNKTLELNNVVIKDEA